MKEKTLAYISYLGESFIHELPATTLSIFVLPYPAC